MYSLLMVVNGRGQKDSEAKQAYDADPVQLLRSASIRATAEQQTSEMQFVAPS